MNIYICVYIYVYICIHIITIIIYIIIYMHLKKRINISNYHSKFTHGLSNLQLQVHNSQRHRSLHLVHNRSWAGSEVLKF